MNITLTQENLSKALGLVDRVVGNRSELAVLGNVMLTIDSNRLKLSATNLEIGVNYWIGCQVETPGAITVPAHLLTEYVSNLPASNINLTVDKNNLYIKSDNFESTINGIDPEEFPSIPVISKPPAFSLDSQDLKTAISQVVLVASNDGARPILGGVLLYSHNKDLVMAATDSYRLAEKKLTLGKALGTDIHIIVPARTLQELGRMIGDRQEPVNVVIDENQVMFKFEDIELISKLVDGQFPEYQQLIPKEIPTKAKASVQQLVNIIKVAGLFARDNAGSITLSIEADTKRLRVKAVASQVGENMAELPVKVTGETAQLTLNCRYLSDALSVIKTADVELGITGKINPFVISPVDEANYTHIIMPLRS